MSHLQGRDAASIPQKSIGRHCLAVGQAMLPSVKMSQSLMTRPVAAPGIHETGIESDFASSMTYGLGSMPCLLLCS